MIEFVNDYIGFAERFHKKIESAISQKKYGDDIIRIKFVPKDDFWLEFEDTTPFSNSGRIIGKGNLRQIGFDGDLVQKLGLSEEEQDALLLHEFGHFLYKGDVSDSLNKEMFCDTFSSQIIGGSLLAYALRKTMEIQSEECQGEMKQRINALMMKNVYMRPEWTCGKYNPQKSTAILYNLIEGSSHYFEGFSADVVGWILQKGRNKGFCISEISESFLVETESVCEFISQLIDLGLIVSRIWNKQEILDYRKRCARSRKESYDMTAMVPTEVMVHTDSAEELYSNSLDYWSNIVFELTYRCSEQCVHCYNMGSAHYENDINRRGDRAELGLNDYKRVIDEFCEMGMFKVCLTGGDPFSHSCAWDIIRYLYEKEVSVEIYTNGQMLPDKALDLAFLYPRIVGMTIYSAIPEIHDSITRKKGSYKKTYESMKNLASIGIPLQLKCCVFNLNIDSYKTIYRLAEEFAALPQVEINIRNTVDGNKYASEKLQLKEEQYEILFKDPNIIPFIDEESLNRIIPRNYSTNVCKTGVIGCALTPEGHIIPCPAFHLELGNVLKDSLQEIWNSRALKEWKSKTLKDYNECGSHEYCSFCAICPGENYADTGSPFNASMNKCSMAMRRYNYAVSLHKKKI